MRKIFIGCVFHNDLITSIEIKQGKYKGIILSLPCLGREGGSNNLEKAFSGWSLNLENFRFGLFSTVFGLDSAVRRAVSITSLRPSQVTALISRYSASRRFASSSPLAELTVGRESLK